MEKNKKLIFVLSALLVLFVIVGGYFLYKNKVKEKSKIDVTTPEGRIKLLNEMSANSGPVVSKEERINVLQNLDSIKTENNTGLTKEERLKLLDSLNNK